MDVDPIDRAQRSGDDRPAPQVGQARAPARAEHELRRSLGLGDAGQRLADVAGRDLSIGTAEIREQLAVRREQIRCPGGEPVGRTNVYAEQVALGPVGHARRSPDEHVAARRAGQRDHDALARLPVAFDAVVFEVLLEVLLDAVGDPEQRDLSQRREVARTEVVRQRRVDALGRVDVAVRHPAPQRLGRHVDELDLLGLADDGVGDRLLLLDAR